MRIAWANNTKQQTQTSKIQVAYSDLNGHFPPRGSIPVELFFARKNTMGCPEHVRRAIVQVCLISNAKRVMFEMMWLGGSAMFGQLGSHSERLRRSPVVKNVSSSRALVVAWPCRLLKSRVKRCVRRGARAAPENFARGGAVDLISFLGRYK